MPRPQTQTTFRSALGEQTVQSTPLRTFEVPDASQPQMGAYIPPSLQAQIPEHLEVASPGSYTPPQGARRPNMGAGGFEELKRQEEAIKRAKAVQMGQSRLSQGAKDRIGVLCGLSRMTRTVEIDGESYGLQTLKAKEQETVLVATSRVENGLEQNFEFRKQTLARALFSVAGTDIEIFLGDGSLEARLDLLDELPEIVVAKLIAEYNILTNEVQEKYFPKNEAEVKEVLDDLKK